MTRKRNPYKTYTKEFKAEAVRWMQASDRPASEIATQLGIRRYQLYKWKEQLDVKGDLAQAFRLPSLRSLPRAGQRRTDQLCGRKIRHCGPDQIPYQKNGSATKSP